MAKPSWITLDKSSGTGGSSVKVTATGNASTSARSGTLTIKTVSGLMKAISMTQPPSLVRKQVNITGSPYMYSYSGGVDGMSFALENNGETHILCTGDWPSSGIGGDLRESACTVYSPINILFDNTLGTTTIFFKWKIDTTFSWPDGSGRSVNINGPSEYSMDPYVKIGNERFNLYANTGLRTNTAGTWYRVSDDFTLSEDESIELTLGFLNT